MKKKKQRSMKLKAGYWRKINKIHKPQQEKYRDD